MQRRRNTIKTIRSKITTAIIAFSLCVMVITTGILYVFFAQNHRVSVLQSAEFNLQLSCTTANQNIAKMQSLLSFAAGAEQTSGYLRSPTATGMDGINAFSRLSEEWYSNSAGEYLYRLLVSNSKDKLLQVGSSRINADKPVTLEYLKSQMHLISSTQDHVTILGNDVLSAKDEQAIIFMRPIILSGNAENNGIAYMAVSPSIVLDPLHNYNLKKGDALYLTINGEIFEIHNGKLTPSSITPIREITNVETLNADTILNEIKTENNKKSILISYPISSIDGWYISHQVSNTAFLPYSDTYAALILVMCLLIIAAGIFLGLTLHKSISQPVAHLCQRISAIAGGDFTDDKSIEWQNELGDIGKGINTLSKDVKALLDTRVANEKEKQSLEFKMLQNQVNPHFIYNTLNSIKMMATIQNATGIAEMTTAFARLLKSVAKSEEELIPLREEFALLVDYCTIQQYRYAGGITLEIAEISDEALCDCLIPRFTLQPLAENAIFHGIEPKGSGGNILLHINENENGDIVIIMRDDGVGMSPQVIADIFSEKKTDESQKFKQIGVRNVHRRILYAFGEPYGISVESKQGEYTKMKILIPKTLPPQI